MPSSRARQRRARENRQQLHNEQQKANPSPRLHNPYDAETVLLPRISLGQLRLRHRARKADIITSDLRRRYREGKFKTIAHEPDKHTLIYGFDGAILGYRIPAETPQYNQSLTDAVQALSEDARLQTSHKKQGSAYRGDYISRHYCVWAAYSKEPFLSADFQKDGVSAQEFMDGTQELWDRTTRHFETLFPSAYKEAVEHPLPEGLAPLAGAFMGCVVNVQKDGSSVETQIHCDSKERPFVPSCLCPIGNFRGGNLILWDLQVVVELKPGDLFFFYDSIIYHSNEEVIEGIRHSIVAFTQQNMWDYWRRKAGKEDKKMEVLKTRKKQVRKKKVAKEKEKSKKSR
jgi:hypothetical protein